MRKADVLEFIVRFLCGGLIIAAVPLLARWFSPYVAGVAVIVPLVTGTGFYFLWRSEGAAAVAKSTVTALLALPSMGVFILVVFLLSRAGASLATTIATAIAGWCVLAIPVLFLGRLLR